MTDATTTHECPICGDVHLPPTSNEVQGEAPVEHKHKVERAGYLDLAGKPVWRCIHCGGRVKEDGSPWRPGANYPWG